MKEDMKSAGKDGDASKIAENRFENMDPEVKEQMPIFNSVTRNLRQIKQNLHHSSSLKNPKKLADIVLPDDCKYFLKADGTPGDQFVHFDSGPESGNDRIILMTTLKNIEKLVKCDKLFSDGTFKVPKKLFRQVKFIYSEKATKFWEIFPLLLTTVTVKSKGKISQNFVAFSE